MTPPVQIEQCGMLTPRQLIERARSIKHVEVMTCDRHQMAIGLFLQGYTAGRACQLAFVELEDSDGALQMIARHRIQAAATAAERAARVADRYARQSPDWRDARSFDSLALAIRDNRHAE